MIKFLSDENIAPSLVKAIRRKGFDVKDIKEEKKSWFCGCVCSSAWDKPGIDKTEKTIRTETIKTKNFKFALPREVDLAILYLFG